MIPRHLDWIRVIPGGSEWLGALPGIVEACVRRWRLEVGEPFGSGWASLAMPADLPDGTSAVLKIGFPDREGEHEAAALEAHDGEGAVRLVGYEEEHRAMLLERCAPGTPLHELPPEEALDVLVEMLPRLWISPPAGAPFRSLAEEAAWWVEDLPDAWQRGGRPFERELLDAAIAALQDLPSTQGEQVLVNQDLQATNVLRAEREPWLVIDPKPLVGEREFGLAPVVRGGELGEGPEALRHRLELLTAELGLDRERVRRWTLAQTLAWAYHPDGTFIDEQVDIARWLLTV